MDYATVEATAAHHGLRLRGGFHPRTDDAVPDLPDGNTTYTLILLGNVGPSLWPAFSQAPEFSDGEPNPLNRWSERVIGAMAAGFGAAPFFPFGGPPYLPFLRWAQRAEPVHPSPLGMLIHPEYGLWHAYRGALGFANVIELPPRDDVPSPCSSCADKPCLSACPVDAFSGTDYDVPACIAHISSPAGSACIDGGCLARRACPVGPAYRYGAPQAGFHMRAFLETQRAKS